MQTRSYTLVCGLSAALALVCSSAVAVNVPISVPDNTTLEFAQDGVGDNVTSNMYYLGRNCTVKLTGTAAHEGALFTLVPVFVGTNGAFTVDATEASGFSGIRWRNHLRTDGTITVKGLDYVEFGSQNDSCIPTSQHLSLFATDMAFVDAEGTVLEAPRGVVFTNQTTLVQQLSCPWRIAPGTWFWSGSTNLVGTSGESLSPDYNLGILSVTSVAASNIVVNEGLNVVCRPHVVQMDKVNNWTNFWTWREDSNKTLKTPIALNGGLLTYPCNTTFSHEGDVTGEGNVRFTGSSTIWMKGEQNFRGTVTVDAFQAVFEGADTPGSRENLVKFTQSNRGRLFLRPKDYKNGSTAWIGAVSGVSYDNNSIRIQNNQTVNIGSISGSFRLEAMGTNNVVVVDELAAGTVLRVDDTIDVTIKSAGEGARVVLSNYLNTASWKISGPATGPAVSFGIEHACESVNLTLGGKLSLGDVANVTEAKILEGGDVKVSLPASCKMTVLGSYTPGNSWSSKVALWLDAAARDSIVYVKDQPWASGITIGTTTNGNELVHTWKDCRSDHISYAARNIRLSKASDFNKGGNYSGVYPEYVEADVNGRPYFKFSHSSSGSGRMGIYDGTNSTKISGVPTKWAMVVFGSQEAKPGSILGANDRVLARDLDRSKALFTNATYKATETYINGSPVTPSQMNLLNGGWQIISFDAKGTLVNGLNLSVADDVSNTGDSSKKYGHANYAEVLLFSEKPTDEERRQVEEYLGAKWGLAVSHSNTAASMPISGSGGLTLTQPTRLEGVCTGTVNLNGQRLELAEGNYPPGEEDIPSANRTLWFDPSLEGAVQMSENPEKSLEIAAILPKATNVNYYLQSAIEADGNTDRRPNLVVGSRGGPAAAWVDFRDLYGDGFGNDLMFRRFQGAGVETPLATVATSGWQSPSYKSAFVVMDTSRGGGTPFLTYAGGGSGSDITKRAPTSPYTTPIWNSTCHPCITNGTVRLDGVEVNGREHGFSGRPEVMSFQPSDEKSTSVKALACFDIGTVKNAEILGEVLFYSRKLDANEVKTVEAYLMKKWLGKPLDETYHDFRDMTVSGSGTVVVPSRKALPKFAADFSGTVEVTTNVLSFTISNGAVVNALDVGTASLVLPNEVTVEIAFTDKAASGTYPLIGATVGETTWRLGAVTNGGNNSIKLVTMETGLALDVRTASTLFLIR